MKRMDSRNQYYEALNTSEPITQAKIVTPVRLAEIDAVPGLSEEAVFAEAIPISDEMAAKLYDPNSNAATASVVYEPDKNIYETMNKMPIASFLLCLACGGFFLAYGISEQPPDYILPVAFALYGLYLIEAFCISSSIRFLCNMQAAALGDGEHETFRQMRQSRPVFTMHIQCYHYETRTRMVSETYTDENGHQKTRTKVETYEEKVVTHRATGHKIYKSWTDLSGSGPVLQEGYSLLRVHVDKNVEFEDVDTEFSFRRQAQEFLAMHMYRDRYFDYHETIDIDGFRPKVLLFQQSRVPWYISSWIYILSTFLLLSWAHRILLEHLVIDTRWKLKSKVSVHLQNWDFANAIPA